MKDREVGTRRMDRLLSLALTLVAEVIVAISDRMANRSRRAEQPTTAEISPDRLLELPTHQLAQLVPQLRALATSLVTELRTRQLAETGISELEVLLRHCAEGTS